MGLDEVIAVAALICLATCVQGSLGFGFAMVLTPLATLAVGAQTAIATSILAGGVVVLLQYVEHRPRTPARSIAPLALAAIAGTPLGLALLLTADETTLQLLVGVAVLASAVLTMALRAPAAVRREERLPVMLGAGLAGGVTLGAISMSGPPVLLYQHWLGGGASEIRGRMFAFFAWSGVPGVAIAAATGIFTRDVLLLALAGIPALVAGMLLGRGVRPRLSEYWFAHASMTLLAVASVAAIAGAAEALL